MNSKNLEFFIAQFDNYLDGSLDSSELDRIGNEIESSSELKAALVAHIDARANIRIAGEEIQKTHFKSRLKELDSSYSKKQKRNNSKLTIIGLALTALLTIAALFFLKPNQQISPTQLEPIAYLDELSPQLLRSEKGELTNENWAKASEAYLAKDYRLAIELFDKIPASDNFLEQHGGKLSLFNGIANAKIGSYDRAISLLAQIPKTNPYFDQAQWYQAIAYLLSEQTQKAKTQLKEIAKQDKHYRKKEANTFLDNLK